MQTEEEKYQQFLEDQGLKQWLTIMVILGFYGLMFGFFIIFVLWILAVLKNII